VTILTSGRSASEETEIVEGVGKASMCDLESGENNFFIARSLI